MKRMSDEDFMAKCRDIDFSADSQNYEANLKLLKNKLAQTFEEERHIMKKSRKFSIAIAAVLAAIMIPVAAFAAAPTIWRYLEITFIQGEEHVAHFSMRAGDAATEYLGSGMFTMEYMVIMEGDIDRDAEGPIIIEADGMQILLQDTHRFYDLFEALSHLDIDNPMLPAYLPDGFVFERAVFPISPIRNPEEISSKNLNIFYSDGQNELRINIAHFPEDVAWAWGHDLVDVDINGITGRYGDNGLGLEFGNTAYLFHSMDLSLEQLIRIAESLQ